MVIELFQSKPCQIICNVCGEIVPPGPETPAMVQIFIGLVDSNGGYLVPPSAVAPSQFMFCETCAAEVEAEPGKVLIKSTEWYDKYQERFEATIPSSEMIQRIKSEAARAMMQNLGRS